DACFERVKPLPIHRTWEKQCKLQLAACLSATDLYQNCSVVYDPNDDDAGFLRFAAPSVVDKLLGCLGGPDCGKRLDCIDDVLDRSDCVCGDRQARVCDRAPPPSHGPSCWGTITFMPSFVPA